MQRKPTCVIVTGRPGSGKTTLSKRLGERLWMPVISRDAIKEGYVATQGIAHDQLPPDINRVVSDLFFDLVNHYLAGKVSVVVEAAFQHHMWEPRVAAIRELGMPFVVVCDVDAHVAAQRHLQRGLEDPSREFFHGDQRVSDYKNTRVLAPPDPYVMPELDAPTVHVSTSGDYAPTLDEIVRRIELNRKDES